MIHPIGAMGGMGASGDLLAELKNKQSVKKVRFFIIVFYSFSFLILYIKNNQLYIYKSVVNNNNIDPPFLSSLDHLLPLPLPHLPTILLPP